MKNLFNTANLDNRLFGILLRPSWFSGIVAIVTTAVIIGSTIFLTHFEGSSIQLDYIKYQSGAQPDAYQNVNNSLLNNQLISNLPLLLFWALIGVVVYLFAVNIFTAIRHTAELKSELEYANIDRHELLWKAGAHLLIRVVMLIVWIIYINIFFNQILPYCLAVTLAGLSQIASFQGVGYILLASLVMLGAIHLHAIMLRLLLLKPRVFTRALYVD